MKRKNLALFTAIALSGCGGGSSNPDQIVEPSVDTGTTLQPTQSSDASNNGDASDPAGTLNNDAALDNDVASGNDDVIENNGVIDNNPPVADDSDATDTESNDTITPDNEPTETTESTAPPAADNQPAPIDSSPYAARLSDPIWPVCSPETGIGSSDSWQRVMVQFDTYRVCVKGCPTDDSFIPDPDFPGLGWNNALSTACAVIDSAEGSSFNSVPLYLPNTQPARQTFESIGAFQVHAGGGQWQCAHQRRNLSSEPFSNTGIQISYRFYPNGTVDTQNNATDNQSTDQWWFDGFTGTRVIGLPTDSTDESLLPQRYVGNVSIDGNSMTIYRTTVDRLACTSERSADSTAGLPESATVIETLPRLAVDDLIGRPMSCRAYDSVALSLDGQSFTSIGQRSNLDTDLSDVFINISQSASVDASGESRYDFQDGSTTTYTVDDTGTFDSTFRLQGEITRSFAFHQIDFRRYNDQLIMTDLFATGGSGSSSRFYTYSLCDEIQ